MSTAPYRAVPRYRNFDELVSKMSPEGQAKARAMADATLKQITTEDYAGWLADGQKGVSGIIDIADAATARGYIQPDEFPDERIYFSYKGWSLNRRREGLVGRRVKFDLAPTDYDPRLKAQAVNVSVL